MVLELACRGFDPAGWAAGAALGAAGAGSRSGAGMAPGWRVLLEVSFGGGTWMILAAMLKCYMGYFDIGQKN